MIASFGYGINSLLERNPIFMKVAAAPCPPMETVPIDLISRFCYKAKNAVCIFAARDIMIQSKPVSNLWLITGPTHSGKTTFLFEKVEFFKRIGFSCSGLLSPTRFSKGRRIGYDGMDIHSGEIFPLARIDGPPDRQKAGRFFFDPDGLAKAKTAVSGISRADLTIVDEIGHLELRGSGLWSEVLSLLKQPQVKWFVVRKSLANRFLERLGQETPVLQFSDTDLSVKLESIMEKAHPSHR